MMKTRQSRTLIVLCLIAVASVGACSGEDGHEGHDHAGETSGAHEEDEHVELTEQQFRSAGIELATAGPEEVSEALLLSGTVTPNADAVLHVTPRVAGQVRSVHKHLGESVEEGDLLCILDSVPLGDAVADYLRDREMVAAAAETLEREAALYAARLETLTEVLDGAIEVQDRIRGREAELQEKAVSTVRPLLEAEKALQLARLDKDKQLAEILAERDARLLELDVDLRARRISQRAAKNRLMTLGLDATELADLDAESPLLAGEYRIGAPGAGIVVDRHVSNGEYVEAGSRLFVIEDLSAVWFMASVFEGQLASVRGGQSARVRLDAFPGASLRGIVSFVDYHVDATSRSVGVRITLENEQLESWPEELPLRPGMFGRVELETSSRTASIVVPERALVHEDAGDYVFVQVEPLGFERRDVEVRHVSDGLVEILAGLSAGEIVAVEGTFLLKSAERMSELGGGHSH